MQESIDDVDKVILVSNLLLNNGQTPLQKQNITDHNRYNVDKKREKKNENEMKWNTVELQQIYMQNLICITKQIPQYKRTFVQVIVALRQSKNTIGGPEQRIFHQLPYFVAIFWISISSATIVNNFV